MKCIKLTYKSPVFGSVQCEELPFEEERCIDFGPETAMRLCEKGPEVEQLFTDCAEDLAFAVPEELSHLVVKAVFGELDECYSELQLLTRIYVRQEPTEEQHRQIIDWISGQMSDGWGEGVEQREVCSEEVAFENIEFDEESCSYEKNTRYATAYFYLHPWARGCQWTVELVGREPAELDIEEPDTAEELRQTVLKIKELVDQIVEELKNVT